VEPLLDSYLETNNETTFAARQQIFNSKNKRLVLRNGSVNTLPQNTHAIEELFENVFSTRSVQRGYITRTSAWEFNAHLEVGL
jgi:hypothetical protein